MLKFIEQNIEVCGLVTKLTNSQTSNFEIIQKHWLKFNQVLKANQLSQKSVNWEKYGITYKLNDEYFYMAAIPKPAQIFPTDLINYSIPSGQYQIFSHQGDMIKIKNTFQNIYKDILPISNLELRRDFENGFLHFEKYDYRFHWNKPDSIIDIYIPINSL